MNTYPLPGCDSVRELQRKGPQEMIGNMRHPPVHYDDEPETYYIGCPHCDGEPEWVGAGWIEMPNNGGIKSCPVCNWSGAIPRPTK